MAESTTPKCAFIPLRANQPPCRDDGIITCGAKLFCKRHSTTVQATNAKKAAAEAAELATPAPPANEEVKLPVVEKPKEEVKPVETPKEEVKIVKEEAKIIKEVPKEEVNAKEVEAPLPPKKVEPSTVKKTDEQVSKKTTAKPVPVEVEAKRTR